MHVLGSSPEMLVRTLFSNFDAPPVQEFLKLPEDPAELVVRTADSVWSLGCTGKFVWPIPDKGLRKRMHRITAPTLIVWGDRDRLISVRDAAVFEQLIPDARKVIYEDTGHMAMLERPQAFNALLEQFLAE